MYAVGDHLLVTEFLHVDGEGHHDFEVRVVTFLHQFCGGLEEGAELCFGDFGINDAEAHATETHHRVHLVQGVDSLLDLLEGKTVLTSGFTLLVLGLRHKFVERRVHEAEGERLAVHHLQGSLGGLLDVRLQLVESSHALSLVVGEDHLAEFLQRFLAVLAIEHVLDTEQSDTFSAEVDSVLGIFRSVSVGADTHLAVFVHESHELLEARVLGGVDHLDGFAIDITLGAVEGEGVAFFVNFTIDGDGTFVHVNLEGVATHDAALATSAGHEGGVRGHTTAGGQDTVGSAHTFHIFRVGLLANEDVLDFLCGISLGDFAVEGDARIVAVSSGNHDSDELNVTDHRRLYNGSALVILRASRTPSSITLKTNSPAFKPVTTKLQTKSAL